jgi:isopentenyldiphosphate isomerase
MSSALDRLKNLTNKISSYELARKTNMEALKKLFSEVGIDKKVENFEDIFLFKAINLSGASLLEESLGEIKEGKYFQVLAISYDKTAKVKSKNISLAYFGRVENVDKVFKDKVVEFIIRYRFEKSFMTLEHYNGMLGELGGSKSE